MAMTYQNFASLGVNLNRQKYGPLDISNVFSSENDLRYYLTKGAHTEGVSEYWYKNADEKVVPYPYEGQVLATVIDGVVNVYALALDAEGNFTTQEIASKIEVDGKTIKLSDEGKLELVGLPEDISGKTYVPSLVNGVLTWAEPDTSTAEGQAQEIEGLKTRATALEKTVGDAESGLVKGVADNAKAISDEADARDAADKVLEGKITAAIEEVKKYADENDADTAYDDSAITARVKAIEDDYLKLADKYDDTELAGRVGELESAVEDLGTDIEDALAGAKTYTDEELAGLSVAIEQRESIEFIVIKNKAGEEVASVNASKFVQDSFLDAVEYDAETGKVTFTWKMGDGSTKNDEIDIKHLVDTYTAGNGLTVENNEFAIDTAVVATVEELNNVKAIAEAAQTADQVSVIVEAAIEAENLGQYAKTADVETALANKVDVNTYETDKGTFAKASDVEETFKGYYTKDEVDAKDYATKTEAEGYASSKTGELATTINGVLATKVDTATIAHTTDTISEGATVEGTTLRIVVDAYTKAETLDKISEKITEINGGESAGEVLSQLNSYKETNDARVGAIETSLGAEGTVTKAVAAAQTAADDANRAVQELTAGQVTTNKNDITAINTQVGQINTTVSGHQSAIAALQQAQTTLEGKIDAETSARETLAATVNTNIVDITALKTKDASLESEIQANTAKFAEYSTTAQMNKAIDEKIAAIDSSAMQDAIEANTAAIEAEVERATAAEEANSTQIATLVGSDTGKSARNIAKEEVAAIVGAAPEAMNTLEEVAAWIANDQTGAAAMSAAIAANTSALAILNGDEEGSVNKKIADAIAAIPQIPTATVEKLGLVKASDTISVGADGTMNVAKVSTDLLVQGDTELVLHGGNAQ